MRRGGAAFKPGGGRPPDCPPQTVRRRPDIGGRALARALGAVSLLNIFMVDTVVYCLHYMLFDRYFFLGMQAEELAAWIVVRDGEMGRAGGAARRGMPGARRTPPRPVRAPAHNLSLNLSLLSPPIRPMVAHAQSSIEVPEVREPHIKHACAA